jgi:hypothetical protein
MKVADLIWILLWWLVYCWRKGNPDFQRVWRNMDVLEPDIEQYYLHEGEKAPEGGKKDA